MRKFAWLALSVLAILATVALVTIMRGKPENRAPVYCAGHGGRLWAENSADARAMFWCVLPAAQQTATAA
jgi:putative hemolysin